MDITNFTNDIKDKYLQAKEMYNRCLLNGFNALIVKCSDLCDNIDFLSFTEPDMRKELLKKYELFLNISKKIIGKEKVYKELLKKYKDLLK